MEYQLYGDRLLCRPIQIVKKTASGIILGGNTEEEERDTTFARVIAVGEGKYFDSGLLKPMSTQVGDVVVYRDNMPLKFKSPEGTFDVINESNVLMNVKGEDVEEADGNYQIKASDMTEYTQPRRLG